MQAFPMKYSRQSGSRSYGTLPPGVNRSARHRQIELRIPAMKGRRSG
jgi:hypothetical protein